MTILHLFGCKTEVNVAVIHLFGCKIVMGVAVIQLFGCQTEVMWQLYIYLAVKQK